MIDKRDPIFGCDYCADEQNRWYGHLTQIGSDEARRTLLLRCPLCGTLYEDSNETGITERLSSDEARRRYPNSLSAPE